MNTEGLLRDVTVTGKELTQEEIAQFFHAEVLYFDGESQCVEVMPDGNGKIVKRPREFEINRNHPLAVGMTGGPC